MEQNYAHQTTKMMESIEAMQRSLNKIDTSKMMKSILESQRILSTIATSHVLNNLIDGQRLLSKIDTSTLVKSIVDMQRTMSTIDPRILDNLIDSQRILSKLDTSKILKNLVDSQRILSTVDISRTINIIVNDNIMDQIDSESLNQLIYEYSIMNENDEIMFDEQFLDSEKPIDNSFKNISRILNTKSNGLLESFETFKQKQTFLYVLFWFIYSLFIVPVATEVAKDFILNSVEYSNETPKQNMKELKKEMTSEFEDYEHYLNSTRITNRETSVYRASLKKSGKIDTIPSNRPVIILMKKRNWSLIIYTNKDGIECTGWVFTGNLLK